MYIVGFSWWLGLVGQLYLFGKASSASSTNMEFITRDFQATCSRSLKRLLTPVNQNIMRQQLGYGVVVDSWVFL